VDEAILVQNDPIDECAIEGRAQRGSRGKQGAIRRRLEERSHDAIAGSEPRDAFVYCQDFSGAVGQRNKIASRCVSEVRAGDDRLIPSVQRCGAKPNEHLAGPRSRIRTLHLPQLGNRLAPAGGNVCSHGLIGDLLYTFPGTHSAVMSLTFVVLSMLRSATSARSAATGDSDRLAQLMNFVASSSSVRRPG
jgi:hypothetical protein